MIGRLALSASITITAGCIVTGVGSQETAPSTLTLNNISLKPRPQEPGHYDAYANLKLHHVNPLCDVFLPIFMHAGCQEFRRGDGETPRANQKTIG